MNTPPTAGALGVSIHRDLNPGEASAITLAAGRWALAPQSSLPFVEVLAGGRSAPVTWGHVVEVPEGQSGQVRNVSLHSGDAVLVRCDSAPPRAPSAITLQAGWALTGEGEDAVWTTRQIDVRTARRVYLWVAGLSTTGSVQWTRTHRAFEIGRPNWDLSLAVLANNGVVVETLATTTFHVPLPCGIGSGQHLDTSAPAPGRTLQAVCPHALRDTVQVSATAAALDAVGFEVEVGSSVYRDAFFVVEY